MALFKKKNQSAEAAEAVEKTNEMDYKELVLKALDKKMEKGNLYDGCVIMPRGFTIDVKVGKVEDKGDVKLFQAMFVISHDDFDEPLIDPVDAQGKTFEDAAKMAVDIFYGGVWHPLEQAMQKKNPVRIPVTYLKQHYEFEMFAQSIVRIGAAEKGQPTMLVNFVINEMPKYLGSKKYYWLRIYLAKHKDREIIEVRINGSVCTELSKFFSEYVRSWDAENTFICEKQCAIFVQRDDDLCPFTKEDIVNGAKFVLDKLVSVDSQEEYTAMTAELEEMIGDKNVASEIRIFVPEIMAKLTLGYKEGDSLFLIEGENNIEFKKTQLRSYFYIQQAIIEYLSKKPSQENVQNIVRNSVAFRELRKVVQAANEKAEKAGQKSNLSPQDLYVPGTAYKVGTEEYKPW
ncbi:MAG: hypothetical protein J6A57_02260 [Ruminococcus sp.]|nr:hypothetical protein [Ruminococcus sp.]MBQ9140088.1 hypothetical protein [Ruminococcus sp.]